MRQQHIKTIVSVSIVFGVAIWLVLFLWQKYPVVSWDSVRSISVSLTVVGIFWAFYFKWLWTWPYLNQLLYKPNLRGTWLGEFSSDWEDEEGEGVPPGKFILVIRQSWLSLSIKAFTEKQKTISHVENLLVSEGGTKLLAYLYSEKRAGPGRHGARQGAAELDLVESAERMLLEGDFWTQAKTAGYIRVRRASASEYVESFQDALTVWPVVDAWACMDKEKR